MLGVLSHTRSQDDYALMLFICRPRGIPRSQDYDSTVYCKRQLRRMRTTVTQATEASLTLKAGHLRGTKTCTCMRATIMHSVEKRLLILNTRIPESAICLPGLNILGCLSGDPRTQR